MALTTANMSLTVWDQPTDPFDYQALAANWQAVDDHTHALGKGTPIPTGGIADGAITNVKIADNAITSTKLATGAISNLNIADNAVTGAKVTNDSITKLKCGSDIVPSKGAVNSSEALRAIGSGLGQVVAGNDGRLTNARIPTGNAGGDLEGTYPNPTVRKPSVRVQKQNAVNISSGASYKVYWTYTDWDSEGDSLQSNTRVYFRKSGIYLVQGMVAYSTHAAGARQATIEVNGVRKAISAIDAVRESGTAVVVSTTVSVNNGNYVELVALHTASYQGSPVTLQTISGSNYTWMSVDWLRSQV